jgi:hypothetical protein
MYVIVIGSTTPIYSLKELLVQNNLDTHAYINDSGDSQSGDMVDSSSGDYEDDISSIGNEDCSTNAYDDYKRRVVDTDEEERIKSYVSGIIFRSTQDDKNIVMEQSQSKCIEQTDMDVNTPVNNPLVNKNKNTSVVKNKSTKNISTSHNSSCAHVIPKLLQIEDAIIKSVHMNNKSKKHISNMSTNNMSTTSPTSSSSTSSDNTGTHSY